MRTSVCAVCEATLGEPIYRSIGSVSITSLAEVHDGETTVYFCERCQHVQTDLLPNIDEYYDKSYEILVASEEEDQVYDVTGGVTTYRFAHQLGILLDKASPPKSARVLDYGCAKGSTLRTLKTARPDIDGHLFDVSDMYKAFWAKLVAPEKWATYTPPSDWAGSFDLLVSTFALEHVARPGEVLATMRSLLKPDGQLFFIVPNIATNVADFVVIDHVNHFTASSLTVALRRAGFEPIEIDEDVYRGAFVVTARPTQVASSEPAPADASVHQRVREIAELWSGAAQRVQKFEESLDDEARAIYGCGFYGSYLFTALERPELVSCFIDNNPYLQGKEHFGKPVIAPQALPADVRSVYVGLNPKVAKQSIAGIAAWSGREHRYFYL